MTHRFRTTLGAALMLGVVGALGAAGSPDAPPSPPPLPASASPGTSRDAVRPPGPLPDPTQPGEQLRRAMMAGGTPRPQPQSGPTVRLRACVLVRGKPPAALIEVDHVLYPVGLHADFTAHGAAGPIHLTVEKLDADGIVVRLHNPDETLLLK